MEKCETIKKLEAIASPAPSDWREKAEWRVKNREWLRISGALALRILMDKDVAEARKHVMDTMDCDEQTAHEILCGNHDFKLSEIVRLIGSDGFFETVDGLRNYLESIADEADKLDLDEKRKLITVGEKPTYCQGSGCHKLGSCLRHSMFEKDGWFNGIRIVDENQCIENDFKMYKEQTL